MCVCVYIYTHNTQIHTYTHIDVVDAPMFRVLEATSEHVFVPLCSICIHPYTHTYAHTYIDVVDAPMLRVLEATSEHVFVPLCIGGGIRDYTDAQVPYVCIRVCMYVCMQFVCYAHACMYACT
jgi:hypothetical protein